MLTIISHLRVQRGSALIMTLMFIAVLSIAGSAAVTMSSTDLLLGGAFRASQTAFHNADAGVNYATYQLAELIAADQLKLDGSEETESYAFDKPEGFEFDIAEKSTFTRIANTRKYVLQVTGRFRPRSPITSTVEVVLQRRRELPHGLFAADRLHLPDQGRVYSYDSRKGHPHGAPITSTGEVSIAASGAVTAASAHSDLGVDGDIILGETAPGETADFEFREPSPDAPPPPATITTGSGHELNLLPGDAIAADPLDAKTMVSEAQQELQRQNDNDRLADNQDYNLTDSASLPAGNYQLKDITLESGVSLTLDATRGDITIYAESITVEGSARLDVVTPQGGGNVNIYLDGPASLGSSADASQPTVNVTGKATTFRLFSGSDEPIGLYHSGSFKGLIYAPYAEVTVQTESAQGYGLLWGRTLDFSGHDTPYLFYTDTALQELFLANDVVLVSWKEWRN